ncbi:NAD(P)H-binding protein [Olivibacter sp. SDN3]|uniref:NAD(P)H-binding protein n=1 Tax=Olivibacter sp. SDN3 TaxID=2764720 RepID=UPI001650EE44|nr:NAD(P)H-binding protein [Olivibacter sp. SDN3]QNL52298.1 NAD(P)H-binding protein [Olivibacter sp. SDN3]
MSNILIIGAKGRVGSKLVEVLQDSKHIVFAASRHGDSNPVWTNANVSPLEFNLDWSAQEMADVFRTHEIEVIYFTAGSRGRNLLQTDLHGAVKTMQAAELSGIKRYIMLSSVFALQPSRWNESFLKDLTDYNIAKHYADNWLIRNTNLDFTILQPGSLEETGGSGKIKVNVEYPGGNSIENVVKTLAAVLDISSTFRKVITMHDGETPIAEALMSV